MEARDRIADQMEVLKQRFRVRCAERSRALDQACRHQDLPMIRSLAHDITGSAGLFGFPALSEEAQRLSDACRELSQDEAFAAARALCASLSAVAAEGD
jgi:HPt (histidine-containing phosphotransfer) domain-containing protein